MALHSAPLPQPCSPSSTTQSPPAGQGLFLWALVLFIISLVWSHGHTLQNTCLLLLVLEVLPEAKSSPSEPLRVSKLISSWLSVRFSSGIVLMTSGPALARTQTDVLGLSPSQCCFDVTFLARRLVPLTPRRLDCPGALPAATAASGFKPGPFLVRPRPRGAVPRLLGSSRSRGPAGTRSSGSLSSLKSTCDRGRVGNEGRSLSAMAPTVAALTGSGDASTDFHSQALCMLEKATEARGG